MFLFVSAALGGTLDEVQDALASGDCARAVELGQGWSGSSPDDPKAWRSLGDGHRCSGDNRAALQAYRRSLSLKPDPGLEALIGSMSSSLTSAVVAVEGADPEAPVSLVVRLDGQALEPLEGVFWDLPAGTPLTVEVVGAGYATASETFTTGEAGTQAELSLAIDFLGWGSFVLGELPEGSAATLDGAPVLAGTHRVLAGDHELVLSGPTGSRVEALDVPAEGVVEAQPALLLPATLSLLGVPEGSTITFTSGPGSHDPIAVVRGEGELDKELGIRVVKTVQVEGLEQGEWSYKLDNPLLGSVEGSVFAVAGQVSAQPVGWRSLETVPELAQAYGVYKARGRGGLGTPGWVALAGTGAAVAGLSVGIAHFARLGTPVSAKAEAEARHDLNREAGRVEDANQAYLDVAMAQAAVTKHAVRGSLAGAGGLVGAAAAGWGWKSFASGRSETAWDPWAEVEP